jgi:hypothetical protein
VERLDAVCGESEAPVPDDFKRLDCGGKEVVESSQPSTAKVEGVKNGVISSKPKWY